MSIFQGTVVMLHPLLQSVSPPLETFLMDGLPGTKRAHKIQIATRLKKEPCKQQLYPMAGTLGHLVGPSVAMPALRKATAFSSS